MTSVGALTIYAIRREVEGATIQSFDDVIAPELLSDPQLAVKDFKPPTGETPEWSARLYLWPGESQPPRWLAFLEGGFGSLTVPDTAQSRAVIVVKVFFRTHRLFAVTFGGGRYQLRRGAAERSYGLRVALNAIYEGDEQAESLDPVARVRQVETRTVGANTVRTLRQTNRSADFEVFELDPDGDQLNAITGSPSGSDLLGTRLRGGDSLRLGRASVFADLGSVCQELARYHERKDYKRRFEFLDNFRPVSQSGLIADLNDALVEAVVDEDSDIRFSSPGLLDYDRVDTFRIEGLDLESPDLDISAIRTELSGAGDLTIEGLRELHVEALGSDGSVFERWPLLSCFDGQIIIDDTAYVAESGDYYRIASDYLEALNEYMDSIEACAVNLPDSVRVRENGTLKEMKEGEYNEIAAAHSDDHLLMDKRTVIIPGKTSAIEVCDVLTIDRQLVHVKRKFSSSSLSHLFSQGYVSSELLVGNAEYRKAIREKIGSASPDFQALFPDEGIVPAGFEIVFAIVGDWGERTLRDLPFFGKINLRKHGRGLRRLGFRVTHAAVRVVNP